jgi:hypothetical protein
MIRLLARLALAAAALWPALATAQQCGDTIYQSVTLQHDIVCPVNSPFGLRIGAPNVTLDLNGHAIVVPTAATTVLVGPGLLGRQCVLEPIGVEADRAAGALIRNGRILDNGPCGKAIGVRVFGSHGSTVQDLELEASRGLGVAIVASDDVTVELNRLLVPVGIRVLPDHVERRNSNRTMIRHNIMPVMAVPQLGLVEADDADAMEVRENVVEGASFIVTAGSGSDGIVIVHNTVKHHPSPHHPAIVPALWVTDSSNAYISENVIASTAGLAMFLNGNGHEVRDNHVSGRDHAIAIGIWAAASNIVVHANQLDTLNNTEAIWFGPHASLNDARGNRYGAVSAPVLDQGSGNIY